MPALSTYDIESLNTVRQMIDNDLARRYTVATLAGIAGMSTTRFKAGFKKCFGYQAFEYAQMQRMKLAYKLVTENYHPIKTIARRCGFHHTSNFYIAFKKSFGISAKQVRSHPPALNAAKNIKKD